MAAPKTLLLGLGNPILSDDGVGPLLARSLRGSLEGTPGLEVAEECTSGGLDILEVVQGYDRLVVLDSIRTEGGTPGAWYHFTCAALAPTLHLAGIHDANFATSLALGRKLGIALPPEDEVHILAVEVRNTEEFGEGLGEELRAAFPRISIEILAEVRDLLERPLQS